MHMTMCIMHLQRFPLVTGGLDDVPRLAVSDYFLPQRWLSQNNCRPHS